jgi:GTP-binding protein
VKPQSATFLTSAADTKGYPPQKRPEIAFAGRSNVGKSTLINTLVGVGKLARTSNTPGRTRLLNWFEVQPQKGQPIYFVDLPGYGFAKVSKSTRHSWQQMIESYLKEREVLKHVFVLIDSRRGPEREEVQLFEWLDAAGVPSTAVLTKLDKLGKSKRKPLVARCSRELERRTIASSSETRDGMMELWRIITKAAQGA